MDESREIRKALDWQPQIGGSRPDEDFSDIRYETADGIAKITIARPEVRNAFRPLTTRELITAFDAARDDPADRGRRAHGRRAARVLLRRGPGRSRRRRLRGRAGDRSPERSRSPDPDPATAQARDRDGRGIRDRGRARAASVLRSHDRRGQRTVRTDRPSRGLVRRRLRDRAARPADRREAGEGGLVPLPPVRRGNGALVGPRERGRAAARSSRRRPSAGRRRCSLTPPSRSAC